MLTSTGGGRLLAAQTNVRRAGAGAAWEEHQRAVRVDQVRSGRGSVENRWRETSGAWSHTCSFLVTILLCLTVAAQQLFHILVKSRREVQEQRPQ